MSPLLHLPLLSLVLATPAFALQSDASARLRPVPSPVRDAGILHLADGTWTRKASTAALGYDVLYDNTCSASLLFMSLSGTTITDEGRIPGTFSPDNPSSKPGCATSYAVDGFKIGYCTHLTAPSFNCAFHSNYAPCTSTLGVPPAGGFVLTGIPGASAAGTTQCWTVVVDVAATPFVLEAGASNPSFGFAISSSQHLAMQGPLLAGDPNACQRWDGTSWDPTPDFIEAGTGMGTLDSFLVEGTAQSPGCYFFGGDPFASFYLELYGTTCAPDGPGQTPFCAAGEIGITACPCGNRPPAGVGGGCLNSFGQSARLEGTGTPSLAQDTIVLSGSQMPSASSVLYFQGTLRHNAGAGQAFGDGLRCAGGAVTRLGSAVNSGAGTSQYPSGVLPSVSVRGGVTAPGIRTYQAWYRNAAAFCTPAAYNTTNGWEIAWGV